MAKSKTFLRGTSSKGSYRALNSWKSLEISKAIFQTWKKSGKNCKKSGLFFFSKQQQVLKSKIFPLVKSHSVLLIAKTFNHKMRSFRTLLFPHCTVVTVL